MRTKKVFLLLNGDAPKVIPNLKYYDLVCAIDGAYNHFKSLNIEPDLVTGDFDSIDQIPDSIEVINTPDQNFTDFEKALQLLKERGFTQIEVYGGSGKEHDHFLGNLSTALLWKNELQITFFDDFGRYFFIENKFKTNGVLGKNISLIPFPNTIGIRTKGLKFPLNNEDLTFGKCIGTRNEAYDNEISINYLSGELLIYISN